MAKSESSLPSKQANDLKRLASKYNTRTDEVDALRAQLDALVLAARESGGTFREIAALAGRSVAWVQGSLQRSQNRK
jgi:CHASE3 domain sensor protein